MATDGTLAPPSPDDFATEEAYRAAQQTYGLLTGQGDWGAPVSLTSFSNAATYAATVKNQGAGGLHLNVPGILTATDAGVAAGIVTAGTVNATTLNVTGTSSLVTVNATGLVTLSRAGLALSVTNNATIGGTLGVTGLSTLGALTATGNVALGDANADVHTVIGVTTFRNAANTATQALIDAGNNRVIVGSSTALNPDTTPNLQVVGRLYVAPESANDFALEIRRSSAATVGWDIGVTSTNDLVLKDLTGTETFRAGAAASVYQATVTGILRATNGIAVVASGILISAGGATITGTVAVTGGITATTSIAATGGMSAGASSSFTGGVSIVSGGLTVIAGGAAVTGGTTTDTFIVTSVMRTDSNAHKILHTGAGAKGTADTTGYVWLPYSLGKPTGNPGAPTGSNGSVPLAIDLTNNKLCVWTGAAWISTAALT